VVSTTLCRLVAITPSLAAPERRTCGCSAARESSYRASLGEQALYLTDHALDGPDERVL
jgi:hypothetical protein